MIKFYRRHMCLIWLSVGYMYAALMRDGDRPVPWWVRLPMLIALIFITLMADQWNNDREHERSR